MRAADGRNLFLALFLGVSLSGGAIAAGDPKDGDAFIAASMAEPSNLIPILASDSASAEVSRFIFNGLVKYDKDLKLTGDLAEKWDVSGGGLKVLFHLRPGILWQDGAPFTASDVVFTYEKLKDPKIPTPYGGDFEKVESVKALDDLTVEVLYKEPFAPGLASWAMGMMPKHLLENENFQAAAFARKPVGTGPYRLSKWITGQRVELSANESYFEGRPHLDKVLLRVLPDPATVLLELRTQNLDSASLTPLQFTRQTQSGFFRKNFVSYEWDAPQYTYLAFNLRSELFADKAVRKALSLAIHRQELVDVVLLGKGRLTTGPFLPESWAYDSSLPPIAFDPSQSKRLLEEAGWKDADGDGLLDRNGKAFSFTVLTNQGNDTRKMACEMIQRRFREIGIEMKIQVLEWSAMLKEHIHSGRFEAVLMGWNLALDPDVYDIFHSSRTGPGMFNFTGFSDKEADRLLEEGRKTFDLEKRAEIYKRFHRRLYEEEPYAFLYAPKALTVIHRRFRRVEKTALGIGHNFNEWYVPADERRYPRQRLHA